MNATKATVREYMIKHMGIKEEYAEQLCNKYSSLIEKGERLLSGAYYVAGEILEEENPPEIGWYGWNPDWEEPEEEKK